MRSRQMELRSCSRRTPVLEWHWPIIPTSPPPFLTAGAASCAGSLRRGASPSSSIPDVSDQRRIRRNAHYSKACVSRNRGDREAARLVAGPGNRDLLSVKRQLVAQYLFPPRPRGGLPRSSRG